MSDIYNWYSICQKLQEQTINSTSLEIKNYRQLRQQIFHCLNRANDKRILADNQEKIRKLLKVQPSKGNFLILGGGKKDGKRNFSRDKNIPHFTKTDGSWFDFTITVNETRRKSAEIIGFSFEIRFPEEEIVATNDEDNKLDTRILKPFLRFDLNYPNHQNEERGMRFHLHPGNDDFQIPSLPLSPIEILNLFLYGLQIPEHPRTK